MYQASSVDLFVPGRVCVLGEHTDWAGGFRSANKDLHKGQCLVFGTCMGISATATLTAAESGLGGVTFKEPRKELQGRSLTVGWDIAELKRIASDGNFFSYVCGTTAVMCERLGVSGFSGAEVTFDITDVSLPMGKGLSSSAAVCVLVARGLARLAGAPLSTAEEMDVAYHGERLTPSLCGRMDQCCAFGNKFVAMHFDGEALTTEPVTCPVAMHFVVADLLAEKDTTIILTRLREAFPVAETDLHRGVQRFLGPVSWDLTEAAKQALAAGDAAALGCILTETQRLFDEHLIPACPEQLASPRLHAILNAGSLKQCTLGGKGVGSQGDGSVQFICADAEAQRAAVVALEQLGCHAFAFTVGGS